VAITNYMRGAIFETAKHLQSLLDAALLCGSVRVALVQDAEVRQVNANSDFAGLARGRDILPLG